MGKKRISVFLLELLFASVGVGAVHRDAAQDRAFAVQAYEAAQFNLARAAQLWNIAGTAHKTV